MVFFVWALPAGCAFRFIFPGKDAAAIAELSAAEFRHLHSQKPEHDITDQRIIPSLLVHPLPLIPPGKAVLVFIPALIF